MFACCRFENVAFECLYGVFMQMVFKSVYKEIGFEKNLPINALYVFVSVVVGYKKTNPFGLFRRISAEFFHEFPCFGRSFNLLMLAAAIAVLLFR